MDDEVHERRIDAGKGARAARAENPAIVAVRNGSTARAVANMRRGLTTVQTVDARFILTNQTTPAAHCIRAFKALRELQ
ncbi:hypothetical protein C0Z16_25200 [Paraburkholderia rhynchosiae]|uniref:Uncharacterized protein n=1 Tax=Paraburkholderia rhynchosiae TaxID=487049 RepID=A0ABX4UZ02_9BURK|nr:hypothetical protein C0Z16_25200 [Paraburkholderia rhynchosiae]